MLNDLYILTRAIQKAQKNGYRYILSYDDENDKVYCKMIDLKGYYNIIFDHNFCKAFFKHDFYTWQHHIAFMAKCEEPLQYIKYYLDE